MLSGPRVLFLLMLLLAPPLAAGQVRPNESELSRRYRSVVETYRAGDRDTAVTRLLALDQQAVESMLLQYVKLATRGFDLDPSIDRRFLRVAVLLHTDAAFRCWDERRDRDCGAELETARVLVEFSERPDEGAGSFLRRWYVASAVIATGYLEPRDALQHFKDAVKKFPDDVPLLTAAGWYSEWLADQPAVIGSILSHQRTRRQRQQRDAVEFLAAAIRVDPRAQEAALRLARTEALLGEVGPARERLTRLLADKELNPSIGYLARLILGDIQERQGNTREAERLYREALTIDPVAQSARIALGHLLYAAGDASAAADVIEPFVTHKVPRERNDPWSDYRVAYPAVGRVVLEELRTEAGR